MKLLSLPHTIRHPVAHLERMAGWSGRLLIEAIFLSNAIVAWLGLPGHEKASALLSSLPQLRSSSSFHFPALHPCVRGFMIAATSAALTPVILNLAGMAPCQNGAELLANGVAMWLAARLLHGAQH